MNSTTTGGATNAYEVIGKIVVTLGALWICWQIISAARMSQSISGGFRIQQSDGRWAYFPVFDMLTLPDSSKSCDFAARWNLQF